MRRRRQGGATAPARVRLSGLRAGAAVAGGVTLAGLGAAALRRRIRPASERPRLDLVTVGRTIGPFRLRRGFAALQLIARGGARYAGSAPRLFAAAGEQRQQLRQDLALETAEDVAQTLGAMKGVLMKIGQMASYVDEGLSPSVRRTLAGSRTACRR